MFVTGFQLNVVTEVSARIPMGLLTQDFLEMVAGKSVVINSRMKFLMSSGELWWLVGVLRAPYFL